MYGIVMAAMLTTGAEAPNFCWGCHGISFSIGFGHGCHGCYSSCYGSWGSCYGCYGGGCYGGGCYGCYSSCYGCSSCYSSCYSCSSCYGGGCYGGGCYGCYSSCYGCASSCASCTGYGCTACYGWGSCSGCSDSCYQGSGCGGSWCYGSSYCDGCYSSCYGSWNPGCNVYSGAADAHMAPAHSEPSYSEPIYPGPAIPDGGTLPPPMQKTDDISERAKVLVRLPKDAKLYVQGQQIAVNATEHTFVSPKLEKGEKYFYSMKAVTKVDGEDVAETKKVYLAAGGEVSVDFSDMITRAGDDRAKLVVSVPKDAKLFVDGVELNGKGEERSFRTPTLEKDAKYFYTLKAQIKVDGETVSDTKKVRVWAGERFVVEFDKLKAEQAVTAR